MISFNILFPQHLKNILYDASNKLKTLPKMTTTNEAEAFQLSC